MISRRQLKLKREIVRQWLVDYALTDNKPPLKAYITNRVKEASLGDVTVDMGDRGELTVVEIIMEDLDSYGRG